MSFEAQLAKGLRGRVVVMGIGNPRRGDDAAGSLAARRIVARSDVCVVDAQDVPEEHFVGVVNQHPDTIVLIDCVDMEAEPGSVAFLERDQMADYWPTTHRMPLGMLMGVLERESNARVVGIGIQPAHTEFMKPVSTAVSESIAQVAEILNDALARGRTQEDGAPAGDLEGEVHA